MSSPNDSIRAAFAPGLFREQGHAVVDQLADYLERVESGAGPVLPWTEPAEMAERFSATFPTEGHSDVTSALVSLVGRVLAASNHLHHPRYVGHQVPPPLPLAALCDLVAALLNNGMAVYEMGPVSTVLERHVTSWMASQLGFPAGAAGILTSGGSVGNLTALLAARQATAGADVWGEGDRGGPPLCVLAGESVHYSITRSIQILGWGRGGIQAVPVDSHFRLRPELLGESVATAERAGRKVIAVVASAGSTATGAFDPLEPIADFCAQRGLWLHIDGAHGASVALSARHRGLVAGIERADSVVWDAHKMMLVPALATAVVFRAGDRSYEPFAQEASYLFQGTERPWYNLGLRTLECTKRMMSLKVYAALALQGTRFFSDYVASCIDLARSFAERVAAASDFELPVVPECNIVCFRFRPADGAEPAELDALQAHIRKSLLVDGSFYLVQTRLPDGVYLRVTLINPLTTLADLDALLERIRAAAASAPSS